MKQKKYINKKNEHGFTLVEVMVALGILAYGILAVAAMQNSALLGITRSNNITEATTVAMDRMERLFAMDFDTLPANDSGGDDFFSNLPALPPDVTSVQWETSNTSLPASMQDSARVITVTVQSNRMNTPIILENIKIDIS